MYQVHTTLLVRWQSVTRQLLSNLPNPLTSQKDLNIVPKLLVPEDYLELLHWYMLGGLQVRSKLPHTQGSSHLPDLRNHIRAPCWVALWLWWWHRLGLAAGACCLHAT